MTGMRSYGDPCGIARALDAVGERWALLIVRELLYGPKRFSDLRAALGASPNVLSQRLDELEASGVVARRISGGALYELSPWGRELHPILLQIGGWGAKSGDRPQGELTVDALMAALETTFRTERAPDADATVELRLDDDRFTAELRAGRLAITRGTPRQADAVVECEAAVLRAVVFGDRKLVGVPVKLGGDAEVARRFLQMFARP